MITENFAKRHETEVDSLNVPYDYGSIMHYGLKDFSENKLPTLKVHLKTRKIDISRVFRVLCAVDQSNLVKAAEYDIPTLIALDKIHH